MGRGRRSKDWHPCEVVEMGDAGSVRAAGLRWLKQKVQLAIQLSQEESDDLRQRQEHSHELLDGCHLQGLKRVPVPPLGNCLLESVVHAALAAPLSPMQLRHAVVDYLRQLGRMFGPRMGRPFSWSIPRVLRPHGTWWVLGRRVGFASLSSHSSLPVVGDHRFRISGAMWIHSQSLSSSNHRRELLGSSSFPCCQSWPTLRLDRGSVTLCAWTCPSPENVL